MFVLFEVKLIDLCRPLRSDLQQFVFAVSVKSGAVCVCVSVCMSNSYFFKIKSAMNDLYSRIGRLDKLSACLRGMRANQAPALCKLWMHSEVSHWWRGLWLKKKCTGAFQDGLDLSSGFMSPDEFVCISQNVIC